MQGKVLVVDDEKNIRSMFNLFLTKEGLDVTTAENYETATQALNDHAFDLVITDIVLGEHTGVQVLEEIKQRGLDIPVIMITAQPTIETAARSVRLGAFDYVPKPIRKETLLKVASMALQHKRLLDRKVALEQENERFRVHMQAVFDSVQEGIVTVDTTGGILSVNRAAGVICGIDPEHSPGNPFEEVGEGCRFTCQEALEKVLRTRKPVRDLRVECERPECENQVAVVTVSPLITKAGSNNGAVMVVRDVTRIADLERQLQSRQRYADIVGTSDRMRHVYEMIEALADTDTTVLILGESGTGKELIAKALHDASPRAEGPYVKVNCSALSENLLESELFGHVKGAFTGATQNKTGRFEMAHGGTILLDEVGDISPAIQLKLLRVLQEKQIERVGDSKTVDVDVRVLAATNKDLARKVQEGSFREDLYYRLKVIEVEAPPLRERRSDIPPLVEHFRTVFNKKFNKNIEGVSSEAMDLLLGHHWPGNVRELEHAMEHAFVLCREDTILAKCLPREVSQPQQKATPASDLTPESLVAALEKCNGKKAAAARLLGVNRQAIYRKIKEFDLDM
ncbi:MAG: sigma-54 dependent transcriptional regulator [Desulfatibacillaceae bacterium]